MSPSGPSPRKVLVVEDAFDQALLVKAFFSNLPNFVLTHAQDGDTALELIRSEEWDLLVTDLNLPGTDGFTLTRVFHETYPDTPILVITGYTQPEYEEQALRAGANQVMIKPLNAELFVQSVRSLLPDGSEAEAEATPVDHGEGVVLAVSGRLGDAVMGCGGTLKAAVDEGRKVVLLPLLTDLGDSIPEELKGASIATALLGVEFRVDRTLFGDLEAQADLLERTVLELRPSTLYLPAPDDHDEARRTASRMGRKAAAEVETVLGYETATTGLQFLPTHFLDVLRQMTIKMEALASFQSVGAGRVDLRPRMAQAYARYWGRFMNFSEVEAFERVERLAP